MHYTYKPNLVCSREISFDLDDGKVTNIKFLGGCPGNLKMISKLLEGKDASYIVEMCSGNLCGFKGTSCADQLSKAVQEALKI